MSLKNIIRKIVRFIMILVGIAFVVGTVAWYYYPTWTVSRVQYIIARQGNIEYKAPVKAVFANEEHVVLAPASGTLSLNGEENKRYRRGESIGTIRPQAALGGGQETAVKISEGGLFFPFTDGLEGVFTRDNLLNMDLNSLLAQKAEIRPSPSTVTANAPIAKIVNNHTPTAAFVELGDTGMELNSLSVGQTLKFEVNNRSYRAKILRKSEEPLGLVVEFNTFVDGSVLTRTKEIVWNYKNSPEGIIIPKEALVIKGEEKGVLVVVEGVIRFRRVKILDQNEESVCVERITSGMIVITTPSLKLEGLPWNGKKQ